MKALAVAAVLVALVAYAVALLAVYARDVPYQDQWQLVPHLTHQLSAGFDWLWMQHNEHRFPLPRLAHIAMHEITGGDFRAPLVLHVALLGLVSAALVRALARRRGGVHLLDAIVPAALLPIGLAEGTFHGFSTPFVFVTVLLVGALALAIGAGERLGAGRAAAIGATLVGLALCGFSGIAAVPPLALWLAWEARRSSRTARIVATAVAAVAVAVCAANFIGFTVPPANDGARPLKTVAVRTSEVLAMSLGETGIFSFPGSTLVIAALTAASIAAALATARSDPRARTAALGAVAAIVAVLAVALGIGFGRAPFSRGAGFALRYATAMAPLAPFCYAACVVGPFDARRQRVAAALAAVIALAAPQNLRCGWNWIAGRCEEAENLERDVFAGLPRREVARRQAEAQVWGEVEWLDEYLSDLEATSVGPYRLDAKERLERLAEIAARRHRSGSPLVTPVGTATSATKSSWRKTPFGEALALVPPCELRYPLSQGRHELVGEVASSCGSGTVRVLAIRPLAGGASTELATVNGIGAAPATLRVSIDVPEEALLVVRGEPLAGCDDEAAYLFRALEIRPVGAP